MKLTCKDNRYEARGPLNDSTVYHAPLIIGREYEGQFLYWDMPLPGQYSSDGYYKQIVFFCFDEEKQWRGYLPDWFEVKND